MTEEEWRQLDADFVKQLIGSRMRCELCSKIVLADDYQWHMETHHSDDSEKWPVIPPGDDQESGWDLIPVVKSNGELWPGLSTITHRNRKIATLNVEEAKGLLAAHNAALAAERRNHTDRMNSVQDFYSRQLAAEREVSHAERKNAVTQLTIARQLREQLSAAQAQIVKATKPVVDALERIQLVNHDAKLVRLIAKDALAKVVK